MLKYIGILSLVCPSASQFQSTQNQFHSLRQSDAACPTTSDSIHIVKVDLLCILYTRIQVIHTLPQIQNI